MERALKRVAAIKQARGQMGSQRCRMTTPIRHPVQAGEATLQPCNPRLLQPSHRKPFSTGYAKGANPARRSGFQNQGCVSGQLRLRSSFVPNLESVGSLREHLGATRQVDVTP